MNYEKRYNEALERAKEFHHPQSTTIRGIIEQIFPELRESEDERIRKNLVDAFTEYKKSGGADFHGIEINTLLSWLEKQKELFESGRGLYYYDGEKTTYCGYPATEDNPYDFAMSQQEKQKPTVIENLAEHIKAEFEGFRNLLKKKGIDYQPGQIYWDDFAKLFVSSARKYGLQKPVEWNEEKERVIKDAIYALEEVGGYPCIVKELKSIRPIKQEWNKEDEYMFEKIDGSLNALKMYINEHASMSKAYKESVIKDIKKQQDFLKSLRPSWKPSKEQMEALNAMNCCGELSYQGQQQLLIDLYRQLKKL